MQEGPCQLRCQPGVVLATCARMLSAPWRAMLANMWVKSLQLPGWVLEDAGQLLRLHSQLGSWT